METKEEKKERRQGYFARCSWEKTLLLTKEENGKRVRLFVAGGKTAPCQEGGEKGSAPPKAEKKDPA